MNKDLKLPLQVEGATCVDSGGRTFQVERTEKTKALRQKCAGVFKEQEVRQHLYMKVMFWEDLSGCGVQDRSEKREGRNW